MHNDLTKRFYDELSADYHLNYSDWDAAIANQSKVLDKLIKAHCRTLPETLLDCSCGIGTQAIGLAQLNYKVTASDLSPLAVKRAKMEALRKNAAITFAVADLLQLDTQIQNTFDIVISCDNSLPHLLTNDDLKLAAKNILAKMNSNGLFIGSIRDYDELLTTKPVCTFPVINNVHGSNNISFQTWDWLEDNIYHVNHFTIRGSSDQFTTKVRKVHYRAYKRDELSDLFKKVGFINIQWLMPLESGYYQPIIVAFKP